jgi:EAL domain-containing protein (putative c-di-GMP-specific phosphodiesterase class I)
MGHRDSLTLTRRIEETQVPYEPPTVGSDLETALRSALERQEFVLHYQPIVALNTGRATHFEALVRWNRPGVRIVEPAQFLGVAEAVGMLEPIGQWVLRRAVEDCAGWQDIAPGVGVAVNIAVQELRAPDFVEHVEEALLRLSLGAEALTIEVTEGVLFDLSEQPRQSLRSLHKLGVRVSLDNFGAGLSPLAALHGLPIDNVKLSESCVSKLDAAEAHAMALAEVVRHIARVLHLNAIGVGIDSVGKLQALHRIGYQFGQGFVLAKPEPLPRALRHPVSNAALRTLRESSPDP